MRACLCGDSKRQMNDRAIRACGYDVDPLEGGAVRCYVAGNVSHRKASFAAWPFFKPLRHLPLLVFVLDVMLAL